jgi:hypothetical protein
MKRRGMSGRSVRRPENAAALDEAPRGCDPGREPNFGATSVNYELSALLAQSQEPA